MFGLVEKLIVTFVPTFESLSFRFLSPRLQVYLWRVIKWIAHLLTSKTQLERIATSQRQDWRMSFAFESAIRYSKKLTPTLKQKLLEPPLESSPQDLFNEFVTAKKISRTSKHFQQFERNSLVILHQFCEISRFITELKDIRQPYDSKNQEHESLLQELWQSLRPEVKLSGRISPDWVEIGFQGNDPATDFRGMGVLGLRNLVDFCKSYPETAQLIHRDTASNISWFGFAVAGINLTNDVYQMALSRHLNPVFYIHGCTIQTFLRVYVCLFQRLHHAWKLSRPSNVLAWAMIHGAVLSRLKIDIRNGKLPLPPIEQLYRESGR